MKNFRRFQRQHQLDKYLVSSLHARRWPHWHQIKHLPLILNQHERRTAGIYTAVLVIGIIGLVISGYLGLTVAIPQHGGEYSEALVGSPRFINPILAQTNDVDLDLSRLVFSGLMQYDAQRQLVPDLAESYTISDDGLTYTFVLRNGVTWHDGEPLKVDDILFTIASIQDPDFKSPLSRSFRGVVAERVDDRTVKLTLKEPFAPFLGLLTVGILPEHLWYSIPSLNANLAELNQKPVGTGPWRFDSSKKDSSGVYHSYTLARNPDYYGQQPYLDKLTFKFYPDTPSAIDALKAKSIKGLAYLPPELADELRQNKNLDYHQLAQYQYTAVFFNGNRNSLLKTAYIREALALATDKQRIGTDAFGGAGDVIDSPTLPGIATPDDIKRYPHDPQAAADLLEKNGWKLVATTTSDGLTEQLRMKQGVRLEIKLTTVDQPQLIKAAELIKQSWDQIGFKTTIDVIDRDKIISDTINNRNYEALLFGQNLGSDPDPFAFWHSSQSTFPGLNLAVFSSRQIDELLETGRSAKTAAERQKIYQNFSRQLALELPAIFIYNPRYTYVQSRSLQGNALERIGIAADRFVNVSQWYLNTRRVWR